MPAPKKKTPPRVSKAAPQRHWLWPLGLFLLTFVPALWTYYSLFAPANLPAAGYRLEVERGTNLRQVTEKLTDEGVLPSAWMLRLWLKVHHGYEKIRPGVFTLTPPKSPVEIIETITKVEPTNRLTVVEGTTFHDLRDLLASRDDIHHDLQGQSDDQVLKALALSETHPEGLFAPDTYDVAPGDSDVAILKRLYQHQQDILSGEWEGRAPDLPYHGPYEALIMASIVEKETGAALERPQIAGVFVRRLQTGMRLQTDPTVIYGMGAAYKGNIHKEDLLRPTPYNTYRIDGLPPTPIALPGRAAIHAALHPAAGDSLYFVARGDGSHVFSATLDAHNRAVQQYQMKRVDGYRSAPAK